MAKVTNKDGYFYDPEELRAGAAKYRDAAARIDGVIRQPPGAVDAGVSSARVSDALDKLLRLAAAGAMHARDTASKINDTNGAYGDVEDNAAGKFKREHGH